MSTPLPRDPLDPARGGPLDPDHLVDLYGERVFRLARRLTSSDADSEDVMQNTFLKVLQKAQDFRGESDAMGWIYRITVNEAREIQRKRRRRPAVSLDALPVTFDETGHFHQAFREFPRGPEAGAEDSEIDERVREAIEELPDGYREAVVLMDLEGLPYKEAADLMGLGLAAFKTRLHRARLHLRERLDGLWRSIGGATGGRP